jgi:hypothetical protein
MPTKNNKTPNKPCFKDGHIETDKGGRPTKCKPEFNRQAERLAVLGATDHDLMIFFEVDARTIDRWKIKHDGFCRPLKDGKAHADTRVAACA